MSHFFHSTKTHTSRLLLSSLLGVSAALSACSSESSDSEKEVQTFQNAKVVVVEGSETLNISESSASGTGAFAFVDSLGSADSGSHFDLTLKLEDGGKAELVAYTSDSLQGGVTYTLSRSATALSFSYSSGGVTKDISSSLPTGDSAFDATGDINVWIDVHNNESPLHTLAWSAKGLTKTAVGEGEAFFNSEELLTPAEKASGSYSFPAQNGTGRFWGVRLSNATLTAATKGDPLFEEGKE